MPAACAPHGTRRAASAARPRAALREVGLGPLLRRLDFPRAQRVCRWSCVLRHASHLRPICAACLPFCPAAGSAMRGPCLQADPCVADTSRSGAGFAVHQAGAAFCAGHVTQSSGEGVSYLRCAINEAWIVSEEHAGISEQTSASVVFPLSRDLILDVRLSDLHGARWQLSICRVHRRTGGCTQHRTADLGARADSRRAAHAQAAARASSAAQQRENRASLPLARALLGIQHGQQAHQQVHEGRAFRGGRAPVPQRTNRDADVLAGLNCAPACQGTQRRRIAGAVRTEAGPRNARTEVAGRLSWLSTEAQRQRRTWRRDYLLGSCCSFPAGAIRAVPVHARTMEPVLAVASAAQRLMPDRRPTRRGALGRMQQDFTRARRARSRGGCSGSAALAA
ncbi:hypothetical protein OBBRIDRAFT_833343 [Obba rivulosa]|uniref:Uncharacterized protein n=1 Tax=Obba rivulosa TaxID=1052685 RepID=A0A8E2AYA9_9APHY|nr:hypothetical protein OBBRIDRAFT_833343 [Obba rivulosa]